MVDMLKLPNHLLGVMNRTVPDWVIQTCWWTSGIFATGALWYFLSIKDYLYAAASGTLALAFALAAITLHRRNDRIAEQSLPTEFKDELPDDYIRRSLDEATDVRLFESLPMSAFLSHSRNSRQLHIESHSRDGTLASPLKCVSPLMTSSTSTRSSG